MKPGRNDPCPCGSGRKYKKCCEEPGTPAVEPRDAEALHQMGVAAGRSGRNQEAVEWMQAALKLNPGDALTQTDLAVMLHDLGRSEEALVHLHEANRLMPRSPHILRNYAAVLTDLERWAEAATYLELWSQLEPNNALVYEWIGGWHSRQKLSQQAVPYYLKALELDPGKTEAANNLGACLAETGQRESALALLCKIVEMNPSHTRAWVNLGVATKNFGDLKTALRCFDRALKLEPGDAKALWNRSLCLLGMGRLTDGWADYESRFQSGAVPEKQPSNQPRWEGDNPAGKTILVWAEQGLGDQIMFSGMVPDLMRAGARCVVECDWRLVKVLQRSFAGIEIVPNCDPPHARIQQPDIGFQIPAGSLARWLRPNLDSFPKISGYLVPDPIQVTGWRERMSELGEGLKVGICWRSGQARGMRSMFYSQLSQWGPILTLPHIHFINLQYGPCDDELEEAERLFGMRVHVWKDMDLKDDQDGLAALITPLDLVISAGTAVDALAGAVGVPAWVLTRGSGDWWSLGTDHCPWNPSVRAFQCGAAEPWEPMIARMACELGRLAEDRNDRDGTRAGSLLTI